MIDLLPFGKIEKAYYVFFKDKEKTRMSVLGMKEVFENAVSFRLDKNLDILTASIPGLVILKLIAWNEKPEERKKDLQDIAFIFKNYFDLQDDHIYEDHNDLFSGTLEIDQIAMLALGRDIKAIIYKSKELQKIITEILVSNMEQKDESRMIQNIAIETGLKADKIVEYLGYIIKEIKK